MGKHGDRHKDHRSYIALFCVLLVVVGAVLAFVADGKKKGAYWSSGFNWTIALAIAVPVITWIGWVMRTPTAYAASLPLMMVVFPSLVSACHSLRLVMKGNKDTELAFAGLLLMNIGLAGSLAPLAIKGIKRYLYGEVAFVLTGVLWLISGILFAVAKFDPSIPTKCFLMTAFMFFCIFRRSFTISVVVAVLSCVEPIPLYLRSGIDIIRSKGDDKIAAAFILSWIAAVIAVVFIVFDLGHFNKPTDKLGRSRKGYSALND